MKSCEVFIVIWGPQHPQKRTIYVADVTETLQVGKIKSIDDRCLVEFPRAHLSPSTRPDSSHQFLSVLFVLEMNINGSFNTYRG
ncbi:unnamed protein product [Allacma fusca]|uniref:Uncharacterized protein n=1 Tax=Allacma fusca TaxID=39272 RepID=A0A8J2NYP8_9HEXA|nr:unnamed protein product [Allacma fusca]